jgi:hypothetical protein
MRRIGLEGQVSWKLIKFALSSKSSDLALTWRHIQFDLLICVGECSDPLRMVDRHCDDIVGTTTAYRNVKVADLTALEDQSSDEIDSLPVLGSLAFCHSHFQSKVSRLMSARV